MKGDVSKHVRLSWKSVFDALGVRPEEMTSEWMDMTVIEVFVDESDILYQLYQNALQDLTARFPGGSWSCATVKNLCSLSLGSSSNPFGTLVNCLTDLLDKTVDHGLGFNRQSMSLPVPAFIFSGTLFDWEWKERHGVGCHVACALSEITQHTPGLDPYLGLFLDYVKARLCHENWRRHHSAKQSLMPWSEESKREIADSQSMDLQYLQYEDLADPLPDEDSALVRTLESALWRPEVDVPWLVEAATLLRIPESAFLTSKRQGDGSTIMVLSGRRISQFFAYWFTSSTLNHTGIPPSERDVICTALLVVVFFPLCTIAATLWPDDPDLDHLGSLLHTTWPRPSPAMFVLHHCRRDLENSRWCPYVISQLTPAFETAPNRVLFKYAGSVLAHRSPYVVTAPGEHAYCTETACKLLFVDEKDYRFHHVHPSCQCNLLLPAVEEVKRLLSTDKVPVVVYDGTNLQVRPSDSMPYVAISHVWAEGMGSTTEEGLPRCVVKRLTHLTRKLLPESGAFWIDSLCVPRETSMRKLAIRLMGDTYRQATMVLVIDNCIRTQCSEANSHEENILWIGSSAWIRRIWTAQEGILARQLFFEFKEGPVNLEDRLMAGESPQSAETRRWIVDALSALVPLLAFRITKRNPRDIPLLNVTKLLGGRTTSKAEDELVAIATLLPPPVSLHQLLAIPQGDGPNQLAAARMRGFLLQLRNVSRGLPFANTPRLDLPNFTWAPRTLTDHVAGCWDTSVYGTGICTEGGLHAIYAVATLSGSPAIARPYPSTDDLARFGWRIACPTYHYPSDTRYLLFAQLESRCNASIDALLFTSQNLTNLSNTREHGASAEIEQVECVAVSDVARAGVDKAVIGAPAEDVRCFQYVAYCTLVKWEQLHSPRDGETRDLSRLGELVDTQVRLM
ncbi:hypothetical protein BN946_scf184970.g35 [Trametes cinnabarina]|uniref:Heterokaryon incompatibility domain-containing protein n=1 Tax=Pycnoporus cinnabarinus TaxID=5643 RepID=A0A060SIC5_PYCCI|nr:hypothetical protein BN946_scf184970.g35 [Trametes cinnabarina]